MLRKEGYYNHGLVPDSELRRDVIKAVAGVIVSKDGRVLVGTEQIDKPSTMKTKGQVSIPFETLKPVELEQEGGFVDALLTEVTSAQSMKMLRGRLSSAGVVDQVEVMPSVWVATLLLRYEGKSSVMPFHAAKPEEFDDLRWIGVKSLMMDANARPFVRPVMERILELNRKKSNGVEFKPLHLNRYEPEVYADTREMEADVSLDLITTINTLIALDTDQHL